ncbi:universal stress protein [Maribacter sp. ACAM166]|uniref:universal stress protein n=1 Tax=Maribacter sp. ACAM166 TaxID=2508996 RepID=UPI0010FD83E1|nr:universal stress protein [Maribacter sp. ACAM166]TLP80300.1 universal stress protein [Maribacter sp. ACAM166]
MKNILVLTDFSVPAWNATTYAFHLFENTNCVFYFLNTYTPEITSTRFLADAVPNVLQNSTPALSSKKGLEALVRNSRKNFKNQLHNYKTISSYSLLIDEVKQVVIDSEIDYIVMGTIGSSEKDSVFMGRNTVRIVKAVTNCPVLAVPKDFQFKQLNTIAFISDLNHFYSSEELDPILMLAKIFHSSVEIVTIQNSLGQLPELQRFNHEMIDKKLAAVNHSFQSLAMTDSFSNSVQQFIKQFKCQLLVMSNITNSYMNGICSDLVIERSTFYSEVPVLLIQGIKNDVPVNQ